MSNQQGEIRRAVSPYLLRPRRSLQEVLVQHKRPVAFAVPVQEAEPAQTVDTQPLLGAVKPGA